MAVKRGTRCGYRESRKPIVYIDNIDESDSAESVEIKQEPIDTEEMSAENCCGVPSGKSVDQAKKLKVVKKQKLKPKTKRLRALKLSLKKEGKMLREIGFRECGHKICMIKAPNVCGICGKEYIEIDENSYIIENENIEESDPLLDEIKQEDSDPEIVEIKQEPIENEEN